MVTAISPSTEVCCGGLKRRTLVAIIIPLIAASYFGGLTFAALRFPGSYDWRTESISRLLNPDNNPRYHAIAAVGVALAGLLTLPVAGYIGRRLQAASRLLAAVGRFAFSAGAVGLSLAALIVSPSFLHEMFARSAGACSGLGMLAFYSCALKGRAGPPEHGPVWPRLVLAWSLIVPPALLVAVLRLLAAAHLRWSNPVYRLIENRSLWHLGFWEWSGSTAVFLFLLGAALFLPEDERRRGFA